MFAAENDSEGQRATGKCKNTEHGSEEGESGVTMMVICAGK